MKDLPSKIFPEKFAKCKNDMNSGCWQMENASPKARFLCIIDNFEKTFKMTQPITQIFFWRRAHKSAVDNRLPPGANRATCDRKLRYKQ